MAALTALVCGHVTLDRRGDALVPGGSAYYAAHALAALGARVRVFTAAAGDLPAGALGGASIDPLVLPSPATTTFVNSYGAGGRRTQRVLAAAPALDAGLLPAPWRSADVLLLAPVLGEVDVAAFAGAVRARVVGLTVQGLVRTVRDDGSVVPLRFDPGPAALAPVTAAILGQDEAEGQPDLVALLASAVPVVVLTQGARGCEVIRAGRARHVGIHPAAEVDPTGAGDAFAAAFLLGLASGDDPLDAARLGAAAGSIVVEATGGEALSRIGEAWERAARVPIG